LRTSGMSCTSPLRRSPRPTLFPYPTLFRSWIMLHGELAIGTEANPHTRKATITLTDNVPNEDPMGGMGDRGILISGGTLNLHGEDRKSTRLNSSHVKSSYAVFCLKKKSH